MVATAPSRAWSCQTLQSGLGLASGLAMDLGALGESDILGMQAELDKLEVGVDKENLVVWFNGVPAFLKRVSFCHPKTFHCSGPQQGMIFLVIL